MEQCRHILIGTCLQVVWALGEGAGMLEQTIEVLLYVILDVIAKTVFSFILLECGTVVCVTNHFLPMVSSCPIRGCHASV